MTEMLKNGILYRMAVNRISNWFKNYFIPYKGNDYKPQFLRHEARMLSLLLILVLELGFIVQVYVIFDKTSFLASVLPGVIATLTNSERSDNNVAPLVENVLLDKAAQLKAEDMASRGYFAHTSPDGKNPWYWFKQVGYDYHFAGENLAVNFFESEDVAKAWMNSPTHRSNIVKKEYTEIGIGVANGVYEGRDTVFVAQLFGTPMPITTKDIKNPIKPANPLSVKPTEVADSTLTKVTPITTKVLGEETSSDSNVVVVALTSPRHYVSFVFVVIAFFVTLAFGLALFTKAKILHPSVFARGVVLVSVIAVLLFLNMNVFSVEPKVPSEGLSASVVAY